MGWLCQVAPDEPTPETLDWLRTVARARATGDKMLVGIYQGVWIEVIDHGEMLDSFVIRQLPDGTSPAFYPPPCLAFEMTQKRIWHTTEVNAAVLRAGLACLFVFDPRGE